MPIDDSVLAAIEAAYEAATDESRWPDTLGTLADATDSQTATLWVLDRSAQARLPVFSFINSDPAFAKGYPDRMAPLDAMVQYLVAHPDQPIIDDGVYQVDRTIGPYPCYDWHRPHANGRHCLVGQTRPAPAIQVGVALHRTRKVGRYQPRDINRFAMLHSHLERALQIGFQLGSLGALQQWSSDLLDRSSFGMLLLDQHRRLMFATCRAETLANQRDGIRLSTDGLVLSNRDDDRRLQRLIARALGVPPLKASSGVMQVLRPSGKRPYFLLAAPVSHGRVATFATQPAVCLTINDGEDQTQFPIQHLQTAFGLTRAEARLARLLANGTKLRSAGEQLGIQYGTARARLADIFRKTQTRRQAELIQLMMAILTMY
jgi:DNA-binding CsgD family transcriptional regulator